MQWQSVEKNATIKNQLRFKPIKIPNQGLC